MPQYGETPVSDKNSGRNSGVSNKNSGRNSGVSEGETSESQTQSQDTGVSLVEGGGEERGEVRKERRMELVGPSMRGI